MLVILKWVRMPHANVWMSQFGPGSSQAPIGDGMQQIWQMVLGCCYLLMTCGSMQSWLWHCIWHCEAGPGNAPHASMLLQASICCSHTIVMLLLCRGLSFPSIASRTHAIQPDFHGPHIKHQLWINVAEVRMHRMHRVHHSSKAGVELLHAQGVVCNCHRHSWLMRMMEMRGSLVMFSWRRGL